MVNAYLRFKAILRDFASKSQRVHPKIVSERLGNNPIAITLDIYSHSLPTMPESATQHLAKMIYES